MSGSFRDFRILKLACLVLVCVWLVKVSDRSKSVPCTDLSAWPLRFHAWPGRQPSCRLAKRTFSRDVHWKLPCSKTHLRAVHWNLAGSSDDWAKGAHVRVRPEFLKYAEGLKKLHHIDLPFGVIPSNRYFFQTVPEPPRIMCNSTSFTVSLSSQKSDLLAADIVLVDFAFHINPYRELLPEPHKDRMSMLKFELESMEFYPHLATQSFQNHFDVTIGTPRGWFDFPARPSAYFPSIQALLDSRSVQLEKFIALGAWSSSKALVASMVSNCHAKNWRNVYIEGLSGVMPVDNYGKCYRNKLIDPEIEKTFGIRNGEYSHYNGDFIKLKQRIISDYPFFLAFENSNCYDYVTEKPYDAFLGGAIPIYMGAPNVAEYLPENSFVDARGKTPVEMAHLLKEIIQNKTYFLSFHRWRMFPSQTARKLAPMESDTSFCQAIERLRSAHCPVT
jgi:hypothetical protein